jgi:hypothetical protein
LTSTFSFWIVYSLIFIKTQHKRIPWTGLTISLTSPFSFWTIYSLTFINIQH